MNRYNQFVRSDYVGLPVDYYQMGLMGKEQQDQNQLDIAKMNIDSANNVEAVYNPDKELKNDIIGGINSKIAEIAKEKLTAPQTLLKLSKVVDDPETVSQLAAIQGNTDYYKKNLQTAKDYRKESGNDINLRRWQDEVGAYNRQGKAAFKSGFQADWQPNKYTDVVGEIQKVLKDVKPDANSLAYSNGHWIVKVAGKEVSLDKLMATAGIQLNDPKYASQLQDLQYYNLSNAGGGDINKGLQNYHLNHLQGLTSTITAGQQHLNDLLNNNRDGKHDAEIKQMKTELDNYKKQYQDASQMTPDQFSSLYDKNFRNNVAAMAATPFEMHDRSRDIKADPYGLSLYNADLHLRNARDMYDRRRRDKKMDEMQENYINTPTPTLTSVPIVTPEQKVYSTVPGHEKGADNEEFSVTPGQTQNHAVAWLDTKGGYNMGSLAQTVSELLSTAGDDQVIDNSTGKSIPRNKIKFGEIPTANGKITLANVQDGIKKGTVQVGYVPGTKEYLITTPNGAFRVKSDLQMQKDMDGISKLYGHDEVTDKNPGTTELSLDGKNLTQVYYTKKTDPQTGEVIPSVYAPARDQQTGQIAAFDLNTLTEKDLKTMTGIDYKSDHLWKAKASPGLYVAYEGDMPDTGGYFTVKKFAPISEFKADIARGMHEGKKSTLFMSQGGKLIPVQMQDMGSANQDVIQSHMSYYTQPGRSLNGLRNKDFSKREKEKNSQSESDETVSESTTNDSNEDF